ncbi:MAG: leucine-rich repeat domain-containing protein, partial [Oscillospiraceae bacterium]|nr:leucine-rich repeat domain-containing protein [Oscillospiraceae bacterium]
MEMKKQFIPLLLALAVCAGLLCVPAYASSGEFTIKDGVLTKYNGSGGNVIIPDGVTEIGLGAFSHCTGLTSLDIPNSATEIGAYAFNGCASLTSLDIPNSVTVIGQSAFYGCTGLTSVTILDGVTAIGVEAFRHCTGMTIFKIHVCV